MLTKKIWEYLKNTDHILVALALLCAGYGLVLIYSATLATQTLRYVMVQAVAIVIGLCIFVVLSLFNFESIGNAWRVMILVNVGLQLLLLTPLGMEVNGQRAWLNFGVASLQPGELGKLIFILTFAAQIDTVRDQITNPRILGKLSLQLLLMMGMIVLTSGDTGMAIQYFMIATVMLFAVGIPLRWLALGTGVGIASVPVLWNFVLQGYQKLRILVLFDPSIDTEVSRQTTNAKIAIGAGQMHGQGLTQGTMTQLGLVPERRTDFIFTVAGEELGFIGCACIVLLLVLLIVRLFYIGYSTSTLYSAMLAVGIAGMFLFQTFMNIFMCIGLLPVMGLTLPLFSYGGTSVVTMFAALGIATGVHMRERPSWLQ